MASFEIELAPNADSGVQVVEIVGELDLTNAKELEEELTGLVSGSATLAIDLSRVLFIDSAALHVLFRTTRNADGGRLGLVVPARSPIARTIEVVGLPTVVTTRESLEDLIRALGPRPS